MNKSIHLLYLLLFLVLTISVEVSAESINTRIAGGEDSDIRKNPFICSLRKHGKHNCGISIINDQFCLTAAHCVVTKNISILSVMCGITQLNQTEGEKEIKITKVSIHSQYDPIIYINDIAVIKLAEKIIFNDKKQPIKLENNCSNNNPAPVEILGWGMLSYPGPASNQLQKLDSQIISERKCQDILLRPKFLIETLVCTLSKVNEGACSGDSGGPLVRNGKLSGIVSLVKLPCGSGLPDIYTKVACYTDWIQTQTQ